MDVPGTSTVSYFNPRKATDNFLRLCRLITELCSDLFRVIFSYYIKPSDLRKELDNNRTKLERAFNVQQKELIYPAIRNPTLAIEDFDISILYILLRNICNIPKHENGWGNDPKKGDNSIAACIERIRCQRNVVFAHSNGMVEDTKFQNTWSELRYSIVEIEKQLIGGKLFQGSVEFLYNCDICIVQRGMNRSEDKGVQANLQPDHIESENNPLDTLGTFYDDGGRAIRFANLFDEISHSVPQEKIDQMKVLIQNSCKIENIAGLKNAISARDCLTILRDANLFNSKDVICLQFLMKKIDCEELFTKCYEYAEKENVLCFHEKPLENGCRNVYFHVHGELEDYGPRQVEKIKATVAAIVECSSDKILFGGICPSSSFLLVLSIENALVMKLLEIGQEDKAKLIKLNIDYFIVDLTIVYLECPKGYVWNIYFGSNDINFSKNERIHCKKGQPTMPFLQKDNTALTTLSQDLSQKDLGDSSTEPEEHLDDEHSDQNAEKETVKERVRKLEENIKANSSQSSSISLLYQRKKNQVDKANPVDKSTNTPVDEFTNTEVVKNTETPAQTKTDISDEKSMRTTSQKTTNKTDLQRTKTPDVKSTEKRTIKSKTTEADTLPDTSCEYADLSNNYIQRYPYPEFKERGQVQMGRQFHGDICSLSDLSLSFDPDREDSPYSKYWRLRLSFYSACASIVNISASLSARG